MLAFLRHSRNLRRIVAGAALLAYAAVMSGAPLPAGRKPAPKSGELFPCATSSCGCDSAERCWSSCCCHTLVERLAWAKEHNVRPPAFALAEARTAGLDTSKWDGPRKKVTAVAAVATNRPCCCCEKKLAATSSCCSKRNASTKHKESDDRSVVGWRALACHGQSLHWLAAVPTLIVVEHNLADQLPLVSRLAPPSSDSASGIADVPTPPPPERA